MSEERITVIPLRLVLTKNGKTLLTYAVDEANTDKIKGMLVLEQWIPSEVPFKNISAELIGNRLDGLYHYKKTFNGQARFELTQLFDENGVSLLG